MTPGRRVLLPLLALPLLAQGRPPIRLRPRPGGPPCVVRAGFDPPPAGQGIFQVRLVGPDAPSEVLRVGSWYGRARLIGPVHTARRDLLLVATEGNRGTGVYQEWLIIAGCDDAGAFRVLGIEVLSHRETQGVTSGNAWLAGRVTAAPGGAGLRVSYESTRLMPLPRREGQPPRLGAPTVERWRTILPWTGAGALPAPASPPGAGPIQRQADATRARVSALLASPVSDLVALEGALGDVGLYELGALYPDGAEPS